MASALTNSQQLIICEALTQGKDLATACTLASASTWDFGFTVISDPAFKVLLDDVVQALAWTMIIDWSREARRPDNPRANDARRLFLNVYRPVALTNSPAPAAPSA